MSRRGEPVRGRAPRGGFTVLEALVGLLLTGLLTGLVLATLAAQRRVQGALTHRAELLATVRTARHVLGREARAGAGGAGVWAVGPDSVALRSFRGHGLVCPPGEGGGLDVRSMGHRRPHAGDDSVLVVYADAPAQVRALLDVAGGTCAAAPPGAWERWTLSAPVPRGAILVRYFHSGSYHVGAGALRYRTGAAGRQPLTPEILDDGVTAFVPAGPAVDVVLAAERGGGAPVRVRLFPGTAPGGPP